MILLSLLNVLVTVSDLISLFMFPFLVTARFGLSQQVARGELLSRYRVLSQRRERDTDRGRSKIDGRLAGYQGGDQTRSQGARKEISIERQCG